MHPGEWEAAKSQGRSLDHLEIIADENGGHRTICHASDTSTCDHGYKPLDCASYPFFPVLSPTGHEIDSMIKGSKCPLPLDRLGRHAAWVHREWQQLVDGHRDVKEWLRRVELVGYEVVPLADLLSTSK